MSTAEISSTNRISHLLGTELPAMVRTTLPPEMSEERVRRDADSLKAMRALLETSHKFANVLRANSQLLNYQAEVGAYELDRDLLVQQWFEAWLQCFEHVTNKVTQLFNEDSVRDSVVKFMADFDFVKSRVEEQRAYNVGNLRFLDATSIKESPPDQSWYDEDEDW
jgi:hypothetical protein